MWSGPFRRRWLVAAGSLAACAHHDVAPSSPVAASVATPTCRFGTDYGSGIVALGLSPRAHRGFVLAREALVAEACDIVLSAVSGGEPYAPHITLIYGVTPENDQAIAASLQRQASLHESIALEIDDLVMWDLGDSDKTALVATVRDREGRLAALHQALQPLTGQADRYPYQPHITIGYLVRGRRPAAKALRRLRDRLTAVNSSLRVAWMTDRCGQPSGYEVLAGTQGGTASAEDPRLPSRGQPTH